MSDLTLAAVAALWGAAAGLLVPRAAYRFGVPPDQPWRDRCPEGHLIRGAVGGWLGFGRCGECAGSGRTSSGAPDGDSRTSSGAPEGDGRMSSEAPDDGSRTASEAPEGDSRTSSEAPDDGSRSASETPKGNGGTPASSSPSYGPNTPLVSVITALICAGLALATSTRPELAVWLLLAPLGVLLAVVDFTVQRLPDVLTLPLAGAALVLLGAVAAVPEHAGDWLTALYGALALGGAYFVLFLIDPNGMGFGDVKLALGIGAVLGWYGWGVVFLGTFAGFLFGGLYGMALVVVRRAGRKTSIPFGPFLIAGAYAGLLIGA
ncbi:MULTISPECIES: prepilin peptidase [Streptomyces]|uniref:Prepilin peptidase n=1 Tax=Streptomyces dengpaensis TaxID=2049881 RepID=A0ABM6SRF8_9ACTN|nr:MULTISPECIES: prepilin peptidase [Streptomyces]AVH57179.1 prepilin peptidase [Streptomyces dengpaensis]PIB08920.1 prepilin peptidase [Streptomyces sp. HG99]